MPRKKRTTYDDKRKNVIAKLVFISLILALTLLTNILFMSRKPSNLPSKSSNKLSESEADQLETDPEVLGERIINEDAIKENVGKTVDSLQKQALTAKSGLQGGAEEAIEVGREQAQKTVSSAIYESTIKPLLEKINELPNDQQDMIREAVCR